MERVLYAFPPSPLGEATEPKSSLRPSLLFPPAELQGLLSGLLHPEPGLRSTLEAVLQATWIRQPINLGHYSWEEVFPTSYSESLCCFIAALPL